MLAKLPSYNIEPFKRDIFSHLFKNFRGIFDHGTTFKVSTCLPSEKKGVKFSVPRKKRPSAQHEKEAPI